MTQSRKTPQQAAIARAEKAGENLVAVGSAEFFALGHTQILKGLPKPPSRDCWHCGHQDCMVDVPDPHPYHKCSLCGATAVDLGTLSAPAYTERTERDGSAKIRVRTPGWGARGKIAKYD